jgi:hypothetical protein
MVMPMLEREDQALFIKKFEVKKGVGGGGDKS